MQLNFTSGNPQLSRIALFSVSSNWVNLSVRHLPDAEQAETLAMLEALNAEWLNTIEDKQSLQISSLRYQDGVYKRAYAASLHSLNSSFAIKFGKDILPLPGEALDEMMAEIAEVQLEEYEQPSLVLTRESDEFGITVFVVPLRLNQEGFDLARADQKMFVKKLQLAFKKGKLEGITQYLLEATETAGGGGQLPVVALKELPELEEIDLVAIKKVDISGRVSYVMTVPYKDGQANVWAPSSLVKLFELGAVITDATQIIYRCYTNASGKTCYDAKLINYDLPQEDSNLMSLFGS